jgi:hypothetical protein
MVWSYSPVRMSWETLGYSSPYLYILHRERYEGHSTQKLLCTCCFTISILIILILHTVYTLYGCVVVYDLILSTLHSIP